jgi:hypothetical protein
MSVSPSLRRGCETSLQSARRGRVCCDGHCTASHRNQVPGIMAVGLDSGTSHRPCSVPQLYSTGKRCQHSSPGSQGSRSCWRTHGARSALVPRAPLRRERAVHTVHSGHTEQTEHTERTERTEHAVHRDGFRWRWLLLRSEVEAPAAARPTPWARPRRSTSSALPRPRAGAASTT